MTAVDPWPPARPARSPYLPVPATGAAVTVTGDADIAVVEVRVRGPWSAEPGDQVAVAGRMAPADHLRARLTPHPASVRVARALSRSGARLHLVVHDRMSWFPSPSDLDLAGPGDPLGHRGLRLVQAVAAGWGAVAAREGKVVWATVQ